LKLAQKFTDDDSVQYTMEKLITEVDKQTITLGTTSHAIKVAIINIYNSQNSGEAT